MTQQHLRTSPRTLEAREASSTLNPAGNLRKPYGFPGSSGGLGSSSCLPSANREVYSAPGSSPSSKGSNHGFFFLAKVEKVSLLGWGGMWGGVKRGLERWVGGIGR